VSEPTIYRYFTSKRELYLEALDQSSREILDRWRDLASRSASPVEALLALGRWYFDELRSNPDRMMLQARAETETEDPEVAARLGSHLLEVFDLVRSTYRAAQDQGLIDATVDLEARTWLFMSIGAILDRTELLGLRARLGEMEIARIIASTAPELLRHLEGRSASNA
jgi:AcrR family transcriptional regulator